MKKEVLLKLARASIGEAVGVTYPVNLDAMLKENPWLKETGASFVTLNMKSDDMLRGCIGSIHAHRPLYEDIIHNANSAAMKDPRFPSLSADEFDEITVDVSVLTEPVELHYSSIEDLKSKISVGEDGVILKYGSHHQATYLPQVWDQLPNFEAFFGYLCQKAGMSSECLTLHPQIYTYQVEEYKEDNE